MILNILRIANVLKEISINASKLTKEHILKEKCNDGETKEVLYFLYSPYITTKISSKKLGKKVAGGKNIETLSEFIHYLSNESSGTDYDIATVKNFRSYVISQLGEDEAEVVEWLLNGMICKDLKIGATSTTINKALGKNFIPSFKVMLAEKYVDYDKKKNLEVENWRVLEGQEVIGTLKIDGNRAEVVVENGVVNIFSREGKLIEGCNEIEQAMMGCPDGVYEGEFLALGDFDNANERFKKTSSIMRSKGEKTGLEFVVFDFIDLEHFKNGETYGLDCYARKAFASGMISRYTNSIHVRYLEPLFVGIFDKEEIDGIADQLKLDGEEGLMVQLAVAPYEFKRVKHLLKCKSFESADIKCVGMYEGKTGKNIGRMGGIVCEYKGDKVNIGGGFDEHERDDYWENPSLIVGKIVEVKFFEEFVSEDGKYDLRFATFKSIRDDKTEESYN